MSNSKDIQSDIDPNETREWLDALESLLLLMVQNEELF